MEKIGSKLTDRTDEDLVRLAVEQNQAAFIVLYTRYNAGVKNHISRYVVQKEDVEDICLESFQKAFSQIASYNPEFKFSTWLYRIARNTAFDHLSRHDREKNHLPTTSINEDFAELKELPATMHNPVLNCVITDKNTTIRDGRMLSGHETMPFFIPKGTML